MRPRRSSAPPSLWWLAVLVLTSHPRVTTAEHTGTASLYVREDDNATTVISPRLRLRAPVQESTHVDLAYAVDVWTSASVDIVASASQSVTEQRDELTAGVDHVFGDVTLAGSYRFSTEPDYESHGGSLSLNWNLANNAATLAVHAGGSADRVGRAGDDSFDKRVTTMTTGASFTQVLDPSTVVQGLYDLAIVRGYQASPYRFIAIGTDGPCFGQTALCLPEQNPEERMRHALAVRGRRAFGEQWSAGLGYRAYFDDWGVLSHTGDVELAWAPEMDALVAVTYRFYTQSAADHYKRVYQLADVVQGAHFTRDKELTPLDSHRVGLELDWSWPIDDGAADLVTALEAAGTFYRYRDFAQLDQINAFEVTAVIGLEVD